MKLEGRVALITGSSRNLGRTIALRFAAEGAKVVINGLTNEAALKDVASAIEQAGGTALPVMADVSDPAAIARLVGEATDRFGAIDVLVSNASIRPHGPMLDLTPESYRRIMAVDLDATFYLCHALLPGMLAKGKGSIVAVSGLAAVGLRPQSAVIAAAKSGLAGLMRGIARDYARQGIRANTVVPGNMATDTYDQHAYLHGEAPALLRTFGEDLTDQSVPMGRRGLGEELASACVFLASDESAYTTGETLHVGGGLYMD